jgi:hypothetical protein
VPSLSPREVSESTWIIDVDGGREFSICSVRFQPLSIV